MVVNKAVYGSSCFFIFAGVMSEPLLLAASLLSGETQVGLTPTAKPETDPWQMVDQMGLLDHQRVNSYQRQSQPLAKSASAAMARLNT